MSKQKSLMDCYDAALKAIFNSVQHGRTCKLRSCPDCRMLQDMRSETTKEYQRRVDEACKPYMKEPE
jgi:hypothetical protein